MEINSNVSITVQNILLATLVEGLIQLRSLRVLLQKEAENCGKEWSFVDGCFIWPSLALRQKEINLSNMIADTNEKISRLEERLDLFTDEEVINFQVPEPVETEWDEESLRPYVR